MFWNIYVFIILAFSFFDILLFVVAPRFLPIKGPYIITQTMATIMVLVFHGLITIPLAGKVLGLW